MAFSEALLASAARTTTQTSRDLRNPGFHWLDLVLDMTNVGTGSVTLTINFKDPASGKYILLLSGAAVTTNVTNNYTIGPTVAAVANVSATRSLPDVLQIVVTANNSNSAVYSLGTVLG
jgi:hypothetical protein